MSTVVQFTLDHYEHMVLSGAFAGKFEKQVELLRGEIRMMSPAGAAHADYVDRLAEWSHRVTTDHGIRVRVQNPIRILANDSEPEPDLAWVEQKHYDKHHPEAEGVLLIIEVAESSLEGDRTEKLSIYAEAGISDHWIVNLTDKQIEVYRQPQGLAYQERKVCRGDEAVCPLALPETNLQPAFLFLKD